MLRTLSAAALALGMVTGTPSPATVTDPPVVTDVSFSRDSVAISGMNAVEVGVNVHLTDDTGVTEQSVNEQPYPLVVLERTQGGGEGGRIVAAQLALRSGSAKSGQWLAKFHVPSTWAGRWEVARVLAYDTAGNRLDVDPRKLPLVTAALNVRGTHLPALSLSLTPRVVTGSGAVVMTGRATYADTGAGIPRLGVSTGSDNTCAEGELVNDITTDAAGYFRKTFQPASAMLFCARLLGPPRVDGPRVVIVGRAGVVRVQYVVTAAPARTSAPAGVNTPVHGKVFPQLTVGGQRVLLQRLSGGTWVSVSQAIVRASNRFTVTATPPTVGAHQYRVYKPGGGGFIGGVSKPFTIRGT